eukprot:2431658-Amphidinium_carterae.1
MTNTAMHTPGGRRSMLHYRREAHPQVGRHPLALCRNTHPGGETGKRPMDQWPNLVPSSQLMVT